MINGKNIVKKKKIKGKNIVKNKQLYRVCIMYLTLFESGHASGGKNIIRKKML